MRSKTLLAALLLTTAIAAQAKSSGPILLCGNPNTSDAVRERFVRLARGAKGRVVIVTTASRRAAMVGDSFYTGPWEGAVKSVEVFHAGTREQANASDLARRFEGVTGFWFLDGDPARLEAKYAGTEFSTVVRASHASGAAIGACGASIAVLGHGGAFSVVQDVRLTATEDASRLSKRIALGTGSEFGIAVPKTSTIVVRGRQVRAREGSWTLVLPPFRAAFEGVAEGRSRPDTRVVASGTREDLVELRRAAAARRSQPSRVGAVGVREDLAKGSLMLVGGGRVSSKLWKRFVALAGGEDARILVIPTAGGDRVVAAESYAAVMLRREGGAKRVRVWHAATRAQANDEVFCAPLKDVRGIWFSGGRQWRLVDRYEGTRALEMFGQVLRRGGVVGGSSAGCSIHAQCMVRGSPRGNREMLAEGYERGFGFFQGAAVDQHFGERKRGKDLRALVDFYPKITGIGVDERTAIVVRGTTATVLGPGSVTILAPKSEARRLEDGESVDFAR